jgi:Family of unknown function (DUF6233)
MFKRFAGLSTIEHVSDSPPSPRVSVTLPGGRTVSARLLRWVQTPDGTWRAEVALAVPARAVTPVDGEDYSAVPRERPEPSELWVIAPIGRDPDGPHEVHDAARCWLLRGGRTVTRDEARAAIAQGATACTVCRPEP